MDKLKSLVKQLPDTSRGAEAAPRPVVIVPDQAWSGSPANRVWIDLVDDELERLCAEHGVRLMRYCASAAAGRRFEAPEAPDELRRYARELREAREQVEVRANP